jgi:phosphate transport system substrate-binding protein
MPEAACNAGGEVRARRWRLGLARAMLLAGLMLAGGVGLCLGQAQKQAPSLRSAPRSTSQSTLVKGKVGGQPLNGSAVVLPDIGVQAFSAAGVERDAGRTDGTGGFALKIPAEDPVYKLIVWDVFNRWWGREISDLHNDGKPSDLGAIVLRPQSDVLSSTQKQEQSSVAGWLTKHSPLAAALLQVRLGVFDKKGESGKVRIQGGGPLALNWLQTLWEQGYEPSRSSFAQIHYEVLHNGETVQRVNAGTLDFGATTAAPTDAELAGGKSRLVKIPVALGGVCVVYHSDRLRPGLRFTGGLLAKIYLGTIRRWNDAEIATINPDVELPDLPITVIYSKEARATSVVFSRYLSAAYPEWKGQSPAKKAMPQLVEVERSPNGGGPDDIDVLIANASSKTEGSIAYVDSTNGLGSRQVNWQLSVARIQNSLGNYVAPSTSSIVAAVAGVKGTAGLREAMAKPASPEAYPMASAYWMVVPVLPEEPKKTLVLLDYINFSLGLNQDREQMFGYVPLPPALVTGVSRELNGIAAELLGKVSGPHLR